MKLNEGQDQAKVEMLQTVMNPNKRLDTQFHTLSGGAGFGKSTVVADFIRNIPKNYSIGVTAPTHQAVEVIADMILKNGLHERVDTRTIHSALSLKLVPRGTEEVVIRDDYAKRRYYDVIIIDECSMIDDALITYIIEAVQEGYVKVVIFVGDECQISPVNGSGEISPTFSTGIQSKLLIPVRTGADNPLYSLSTKLRECQAQDYYELPKIVHDVDSEGRGIHVLSPQEFVTKFFEFVNSDDFRENIYHARCVAFTNDCVDKINASVRQHLHGADVPEFIEGEVLIAQESYGTQYESIYRNSEELEIISLVESVCFDHTTDGISCFELKLRKLSDGEFVNVKTPTAEGKKRLEFLLERQAEIARTAGASARQEWRKYYEIKKDFQNFKHIYCMTTHKSQGSTFKHTFVYYPDIVQYGISLVIKQILYTATTRSSHSTYFTGV